LNDYLASVGKLTEAIKFLTNAKLKSGERVVTDLVRASPWLHYSSLAAY
jgi:hypothetical protein